MTEWISVDERLPEENTEVLIYCKTNNGKEVFFVDKIRYFRGIAIWQVWSGKVTHWMPLPEVPKMKDGANKPKVTCLNCKHLMFSDMYGECNKQLRIVNPNDTCKYAEPKER